MLVFKAETRLRTADNSGAGVVKCLRPYGNKKFIGLGDFCTVSIKTIRLVRKVSRKKMYMMLVLQNRRFLQRSTGSLVRFYRNIGCLVADRSRFLGSRVFGSTSREVSRSGVDGFKVKFRSVV